MCLIGLVMKIRMRAQLCSFEIDLHIIEFRHELFGIFKDVMFVGLVG